MKSITIDSSHIDEVSVELDLGVKKIQATKQARNIKGSQVILQTIEQLLEEEDIQLRDIEEIHVHSGPGSYTGLRVGAAIANTLAFALLVPLNNKVGEFVYPRYE